MSRSSRKCCWRSSYKVIDFRTCGRDSETAPTFENNWLQNLMKIQRMVPWSQTNLWSSHKISSSPRSWPNLGFVNVKRPCFRFPLLNDENAKKEYLCNEATCSEFGSRTTTVPSSQFCRRLPLNVSTFLLSELHALNIHSRNQLIRTLNGNLCNL